MRVLYFYRNSESYMDSWQKFHFLDELKYYGYEFQIFNPLLWKSTIEANEQLLRLIRSTPYKWDLFMTAHGSDLLFQSTIQEINKIGIPSLLICFDNLHAPYMHRSIAPYFDLVWLTSKETMEMFKNWKCHCIFLPYAANPYKFYPQFSKEIVTVGFIGTPYGTRVEKINKLLSASIPCSVYSDSLVGGSFGVQRKSKAVHDYINIFCQDLELLKFNIGRKVLLAKIYKKVFNHNSRLKIYSKSLLINPSVSFDQMNYLYSNFALSLGITELWDTYLLKKPIHKLHLRTFEIPMCGGLQLVYKVKEISDYFEDEKEIILYESDQEYVDKARFYLSQERESLRLKIKNAAYVKAKNEHSWKKRFDLIEKHLFH